jgi:two-component system nitrate/nitrite response regulator NarL
MNESCKLALPISNRVKRKRSVRMNDTNRHMNRSQERSPERKKRSVLLADDDPIVREVVRTKLSAGSEFQVIGEATDGKSAIEQVEQLHPDVLLLDLLMPNLPGIDALQELSARHSQVHTIVFSASVGPQQIVQALQLGARGILSKKSIAQLESAIRSVISGNYWVEGREETSIGKILADISASIGAETQTRSFGLTNREIEVITLVTEGCSNREIASRLNITEDTVKRHLTNIFDKVGMSTRLELALFALKNSLATPRSG